MAGCAPCRHVATEVRDSVAVKIVPRQVVVCDTAWVEIAPSIQSVVVVDSSYLENDYAQSEARILADGRLHHTLASRAQSLAAPVVSRVEVRDSVIYRQRVQTKILERERELTRWQRMRLDGFWILAAIVALGLYLKVR